MQYCGYLHSHLYPVGVSSLTMQMILYNYIIYSRSMPEMYDIIALIPFRGSEHILHSIPSLTREFYLSARGEEYVKFLPTPLEHHCDPTVEYIYFNTLYNIYIYNYLRE